MKGDKFTEEELSLLKTILNYPKMDTNQIEVGRGDKEFDLCESLCRDDVLAKFATVDRKAYIYSIYCEWVVKVWRTRVEELEAEVEKLREQLNEGG